MGHQSLEYMLESYLSQKTYNKIEVNSFSTEEYPYTLLELQVNDTANLKLKGKLSSQGMEMEYHLVGDSFKFNDLHLKDKIDVEGDISGVFSSLSVTGYGKVFNGDVNYSFVNVPKKIKDMSMKMRGVDIQKLLSFFGKEPLVEGHADIDAKFECFSRHKKLGRTKIYMDRAFIPKLDIKTPFIINSIVSFKDIEYQFESNISSEIGLVTLNNGYYHEGKKVATAKYKVHLIKILNPYKGKLDTNGTLTYDNNSKLISIMGSTEEFGGELSYIYSQDSISLKLKKISLDNLLKKFSYPVLFSSKVYGNIDINLKDKSIIVNTDLKETRFLASKLTDKLYEKLGIDMLDGLYDKSFFSAGYQNSILSSTLQIDNIKNHIYITDIKINTSNNKINSKL